MCLSLLERETPNSKRHLPIQAKSHYSNRSVTIKVRLLFIIWEIIAIEHNFSSESCEASVHNSGCSLSVPKAAPNRPRYFQSSVLKSLTCVCWTKLLKPRDHPWKGGIMVERMKKTMERAGSAPAGKQPRHPPSAKPSPCRPGQRRGHQCSPAREEPGLIAPILVKSTRKSRLVSSLERTPRRMSPTLGHLSY